MESLFPPPASATAAAAAHFSPRARSAAPTPCSSPAPNRTNRRRVPRFDAAEDARLPSLVPPHPARPTLPLLSASPRHTGSGNPRELAIARLLIHITVYRGARVGAHLIHFDTPRILAVNYKRARHLNCNRVFCEV